MAKIQHHSTLDAFDDALLDVLISESEHNSEYQKLVDMTAHIVFEQSPAISVSAKAEQAFLNSYQATYTFFDTFKNKFFWLFTGVLSLGIILYLLFSASATSPAPQKPETSTQSALVLAEPEVHTANPDTASTEEFQQEEKAVDTPARRPVPRKAVNLFHPQTELDFQAPYVENKDTVKEIMDQERAAQIVNETETYKFDLGEWGIELRQYGLYSAQYEWFRAKQDRVMQLPYYIGKPFGDKEFKHMAYIQMHDDWTPGDIKPYRRKKEGMNFYMDKENNRTYMISEKGVKNIILPDAMNYMMDFDSDAGDQVIQEFFSETENLDRLQPFYISREEVDNQSYQEFMWWVQRYNGFDSIVSRKDSSSADFQKAFTYTFHKLNQEVIDHFGTNSVHIYPDTAVWMTDFLLSYNEPMSKHYLHHPAYSKYPVVGISYWQALAFCDWLTWIWQSRLDRAHVPYELEFDLPWAYEWELAAEELLRKNGYNLEYNQPMANFTSDLILQRHNDLDYRRMIGSFQWASLQHDADQNFHSGLTFDKVSYLDVPDFLYRMEGNVSEWTKDNYTDGFNDFRKAFREKIENDTSSFKEGKELMLMTEEYLWKSGNSEQGKLVQGANWFDQRMDKFNTDIVSGLWTKAFVDPDEAHSTLGFRFVMRVKLKDEAKIRKKVTTLGHALPLMDYSMVDDEFQPRDRVITQPNGFAFIPMGTDKRSISYQAFYAKATEVSNFEWMLFLNDLIEYGRDEQLEKCIPSDSMWAYKMRFEHQPEVAEWKSSEDFLKHICFPKSFVSKNKLDDFPLTSFAMQPVTGVSYEAVNLFLRWITDVYMGEKEHYADFRLPTKLEWEWMAAGGLDYSPYPWGGPYTRNSKGCFLANFDWNTAKLPDSSTVVECDINRSSKPVNGLWPVRHFEPNNYGLYDVAGNAAEMVREKDVMKGGSWRSPAKEIEVLSVQSYDGKANEEVGFRIVMTYLGKSLK